MLLKHFLKKMKTNKKVYIDLKNYTLSLVRFDNSPYIELMVYGDYIFDIFDENIINTDNTIVIFILNYN